MHLIETGHHEVNADGDPDLGLHGVGGGAVESLDPKVLLDPFEEQFDVPSTLVDGRDGQCWQFEVVGQESQRFAGFGIDVADTAQLLGIECFAFRRTQTNDLIAPQSSRAVDRIGATDIRTKIAFRPRDKECPGLIDTMKPTKIDVSTIHYINASGLEENLVQDVHVVDTAFCNAYEYWDGAAQIHQGVQLDGRLGLPEGGPGKHRKAKIDGGGIESVNHLVDVQSVAFAGIQTPRLADEDLSQIPINAPIPVLVRVSQIGSGDVAPDSHRIQVAAAAKTGFDVPKTFPVCHLRKCHTQELVACRESATGPRHGISGNTSRQLCWIERVRNLGENEPSGIHFLLRMGPERDGEPFQMQDTLSRAENHEFQLLTQS